MKKEKDHRKILKSAIKNGTTKISIIRRLKTTKPTFNKRLLDGYFTEKQKEIIEENYL